MVLTAGIAPNGEPAGVGRMTPLRFLGGLLCLEGGARAGGARISGAGRGGALTGGGRIGGALTGGAACPDPPHFDVLAFHPLSFEGPDLPAHSSQDVAISDIAKVTDRLARAERLHTALPRGRKPVWVTELNWESAPQSPHGVPGRLQALWLSRALHRLWVAGVGFADWQFLVDPYPALPLATPTGGTVTVSRPAGLYTPGPGGELAGARPKPFLRGFTLPFDPLRVDRGHVRVWALLTRPAQPVLLQRAARGGVWRTIARLRAGRDAVLNALLPLRGAIALRVGSGTLRSASAWVPWDRSRP